MGYCVSMNECDFKIKKENTSKALEIIKELVKKGEEFRWVSNEVLLEAENLKEALEEFGYDVIEDEKELKIFDFLNEKEGDELTMFQAIAPVVEEGSYIEMYGEDGDTWRWVFENGKCTEKRPRVEW